MPDSTTRSPERTNLPLASVEKPEALGNDRSPRFGSDVVAEVLNRLGLPYVALNPGASYRGLHDSLVNHLGNEQPQMLLCLHEEHAVAIAHGYAKITGRPMGAIAHSNVGLLHASMAVFNAWCDRVPLVLLGATGPVDANVRRPWIDWIHTAADQGALIRNFIKWDDQPASPEAAVEALLRAHMIACTAPTGPVYVNLDARMQESPLAQPVPLPDVGRFAPPADPAPDAAALRAVAERLRNAPRVAILMGRVSRSEEAWAQRLALAEKLGAKVITDMKAGAAFPTDHPLHCGPPSLFPTEDSNKALSEADVVIALEALDLGGMLRGAYGKASPKAWIVQVGLDQTLHNGFGREHQVLPPADVRLATTPEAFVPALLAELQDMPARPAPTDGPAARKQEPETGPDGSLTIAGLARYLKEAVGERPTCLIRLPLGWTGGYWPFRHPLDYLGYDGGGGIGSGPGMSVGAALALQGSGRLPLAVLGDGDTLMGLTALWTAVHYRLPLLVVVSNNRSFFNDEIHQERVAVMRDRPVQNKWIGQAIDDPAPDLAKLAEGQGAAGFGPVKDPADLPRALQQAIAVVEAGGVALVDVHITRGYGGGVGAAVTRG